MSYKENVMSQQGFGTLIPKMAARRFTRLSFSANSGTANQKVSLLKLHCGECLE